jgi:hypothetical protein
MTYSGSASSHASGVRLRSCSTSSPSRKRRVRSRSMPSLSRPRRRLSRRLFRHNLRRLIRPPIRQLIPPKSQAMIARKAREVPHAWTRDRVWCFDPGDCPLATASGRGRRTLRLGPG